MIISQTYYDILGRISWVKRVRIFYNKRPHMHLTGHSLNAVWKAAIVYVLMRLAW